MGFAVIQCFLLYLKSFTNPAKVTCWRKRRVGSDQRLRTCVWCAVCAHVMLCRFGNTERRSRRPSTLQTRTFCRTFLTEFGSTIIPSRCSRPTSSPSATATRATLPRSSGALRHACVCLRIVVVEECRVLPVCQFFAIEFPCTAGVSRRQSVHGKCAHAHMSICPGPLVLASEGRFGVAI